MAANPFPLPARPTQGRTPDYGRLRAGPAASPVPLRCNVRHEHAQELVDHGVPARNARVGARLPAHAAERLGPSVLAPRRRDPAHGGREALPRAQSQRPARDPRRRVGRGLLLLQSRAFESNAARPRGRGRCRRPSVGMPARGRGRCRDMADIRSDVGAVERRDSSGELGYGSRQLLVTLRRAHGAVSLTQVRHTPRLPACCAIR